jgi:TRAP-type C4-dicarboxylate transport system permease small subunit
MTILRAIYTVINKIRFILIALISAFAVALCLLQVTLRYFTFLSLRPFAWGDEVTLLTSICVIFLASSIGVRDNAHFTVTLLEERFQPKNKVILKKIINAVCIFGLLVIVYYGFSYAITNTSSTMQNARISMALFYGAIPVGCILMIFEYVLQIILGENYKDKLLIKKSVNNK